MRSGARCTLFGILALLAGCGGDDGGPPPPSGPTRSAELGFYVTPPRPELGVALQNLDLMSARAEVAMIHDELPWTELLAGTPAETLVVRDTLPLATYLRARGLRVQIMADLTDGLARSEEPPQLREAGRSIAEPAVQQVYRDYVLACARLVQPQWLGLTAETNLVRAAAPPAVYAAMVVAANAAAADLATAGVTVPLLVSVQVETAWGRLGGDGTWVGIAQDLADFPFIQALGLSSYPYFGFAQPEDLPDDYFQRLAAGTDLPVLLCEGGWASASVGTLVSSPQLQARYVRRLPDLLAAAGARSAVQTLHTDVDLAAVPQPYPANLPFFTTLGLMELQGDAFVAKPALAPWDSLFARPREG